MPTEVIMPQMGESIAEGTVTKWLKRVGERVERDEPLLEISTDKVDAEIPSPAAGVLTKILAKENETVAVNTVIAVIDGEGAGAAVAPEAPAEERTETPAPAQATPPGAASLSPVTASPASAPAQAASTTAPFSVATGVRSKIRSSPLVRRMAREHNVDLAGVRGSGLGGRISKKDIQAYLAQPRAAATPPSTGADRVSAQRSMPVVQPSPPSAAPELAFAGAAQVVPMTPMRRQIAEHMVMSKRTSPHVTTVFEIEMTRVFDVRARHAEEFERRHGVKLTYTPFFVRASVEGLKQFPILNASVDGTNIVYKREVNIGVAVALETGLIVPVIKRADEKNFLGIARAVQDLAERARTKKLSPDDVKEGTFTITNPGIFGSLFGTPIINQPQAAILGVGVIEKRPVVRDDAIAIRPMVYVAISFDHRIVDGAIADQFVSKVKAVLENWEETVV
jgi:2-oxoglutarate dehydrogenase E2 component (dihydrolipoamide succinyltransferase)